MFAGARTIEMLVNSPQQVSAALRKLDIGEVTVYPAKDGGWTFECPADLAGILTLGTQGEREG